MDRRQQGALFARAKWLWLGGLLAVVAVDVEVRAQAPASQPADGSSAPGYAEAITEAVGHYSVGRWRRAHEGFARAHALQPSARTYRGLGLAAFYLDELAEARAAFEQALADTRKALPDDQRRELTELLAKCVQETGRIELRLEPQAARVELDGEAREERVLFLDRGEHVILVSADGHVPARTALTIVGGEERSLDVALAVQEQPAAPPAVRTPAPAREPVVATRGERRLFFTWIAAAAVPVFAGTAAAVWFTGTAEHDAVQRQCDRDMCDRAEADRRFEAANLELHATWTNVALAASGVALVTAGVLFFVEGGQEAPPLALDLGPGHSGASLRGRF